MMASLTHWATTPPIDCLNVTNVQLNFYRWLNVERNTYDHAYIQVSNDGSNWVEIWSNPDSHTTDTSWTEQVFDISSTADDEPTVYIRWGIGTTDGSWRYSGWNIDDVLVTGIGSISPLVGDFEPDCDVDLDDFNLFASYWLEPNCVLLNDCDTVDLDLSGTVDQIDFSLFSPHWLEGTP